MSEIKTGVHTNRKYSTLKNKSKNKSIDYETGSIPKGYSNAVIIFLLSFATIFPQIFIDSKYPWYIAGMVSSTIYLCLNLFWLIVRTGFVDSLFYSFYKMMYRIKFYHLLEKMGDNSFYLRKKINNVNDYKEFCIEKVKASWTSLIVSFSINLGFIFIFGLSWIIMASI